MPLSTSLTFAAASAGSHSRVRRDGMVLLLVTAWRDRGALPARSAVR